ncbi:hypothetical protein RUND412_003607 [Rhizina undulata]
MLYWIHPLVCTWARERNDLAVLRQNAEDAITVASAIVIDDNPRPSDDWIFERRILSHLNVCYEHVAEYFSGSDNTLKAADALWTMGGLFIQAEELYHRVPVGFRERPPINTVHRA